MKENQYLFVKSRNETREFYRQIDQIFKNEKEISDNFTKNTLKKEILNLIRRKREKNEIINKEDCKLIKKSLLEYETVEYKIFKEIKGCVITSVNPIKINDLTFYNWPGHKKNIIENNSLAFKKKYPSFYDPKISKTLLSIKVKAKEYQKAYEIVDDKFKKIENILRYLFTHTNHSTNGSNTYDIGIFEFRQYDWLETMDISNNSIGGISGSTGTHRTLKLNKKSLLNKNNVSRIWEILNKPYPNPNKIESRLLNSIEWIGKAKHEMEQQKAFIQYFIAIESLMNFDPKGTISPSVTYQIREYVSFLLGKNIDERIEIQNLFTRLYDIRSSIVHGNITNFTIYDLEDARNMAENLIIKFLTHPELKNINSENDFKQLKDLITVKKFGRK
ncbi:MAG: hypothetical protein ABI554_09835 [Flavobacterium sp.]